MYFTYSLYTLNPVEFTMYFILGMKTVEFEFRIYKKNVYYIYADFERLVQHEKNKNSVLIKMFYDLTEIIFFQYLF